MKNSQKGYIVPLAIVAAIIALSLFAYFYPKNTKAPTIEGQVSQNSTNNQATATSTNTPEQDASDGGQLQIEPSPPGLKHITLSIANNSYRDSYLAGDKLNLIIKVLKPDGTLATPDEGFNVQILPYNTDTGQVVYMRNGEYYGGNATFQNGVWTFSPIESLTAGSYYYDVTAYCSDNSKGCMSHEENGSVTYQTTKRYTFNVKAPAQTQIITIANAAPSAPQNIHNGPGQIFGSYKVTVVGSTAVAVYEKFTLALPVTGDDPLRGIVLVDENGNVVAGPVSATASGYNGDSQEFIFTNVTYKPGTHIYTIKGTVPDAYSQNMGFQIITTPASDWKITFPTEPGTSADLSSSGTVMLNQVYIQ